MSKKIIILEIIDAISEVVRMKAVSDITIQDLDHANKLINSVSNDQEEMISLLSDLLQNLHSSRNDDKNKIIVCIAKIYKEIIGFDQACLHIINMRR